MYILDDTIVALSSAVGVSARGVIRLNGPEARPLAQKVFVPDQPDFAFKRNNSWHHTTGSCRLNDNVTCPAQLYLFASPHSYTGQDIIELHLPGSPALLQIVLESLLDAGACMAQPGEFTARAFLHHRIDLSEAEAVAELINARSDAQLRGAQRLLDGALHHLCTELTSGIAEVLALVEADIDFSQEDIEIAAPADLARQIAALQADLERLLRDSISFQELSHLPRLVIAGPANAGKSCLVNALVGMDRSIVDSIAGTTRDLLSAPLHLAHGECLLIDTAGLGKVNDILAETTQDLTRKAISTCDLLLWVIDISSDRLQLDLDLLTRFDLPRNVIVLANKIDLIEPPERIEQLLAKIRIKTHDCIGISALYGENLDILRQKIEEIFTGAMGDYPAEMLALTARQRQNLRLARQGLSQTLDLLSDHALQQAELIALELRNVLDHLAVISGQVVTEDILTRIFSRFCIGK